MNSKQKKKTELFISDIIQHIKTVPVCSEQTFQQRIAEYDQISREYLPLQQPAIEMIQHLQNSRNENCHRNLCCHRKAKIIRHHNSQRSQRSLELNHKMNADTKVCDDIAYTSTDQQNSQSTINTSTSENQLRSQNNQKYPAVLNEINYPKKQEFFEREGTPFKETRDDAITDQVQSSSVNESFSSTEISPIRTNSEDSLSSANEQGNEMTTRKFETNIDEVFGADQNKSKENISFITNSPFSTKQNIDVSKKTILPDANQTNSSTNMKFTPTSLEHGNDHASILMSLGKHESTKKTNALNSLTAESIEKIPNTQSCNCCCNFLHYSLRQIMHDAEQMKQFALNMAMIDIDPLKSKDSNNKLYPAICIPMYNCESIRDQRFPTGASFTMISTNEIDHENKHDDMIIQTINTQRGPIKIKLDPKSFGLAPFFSDRYETYIKEKSKI